MLNLSGVCCLGVVLSVGYLLDGGVGVAWGVLAYVGLMGLFAIVGRILR